MNNKQLLNRAYNRMLEVYSGEQASADISFLNRFYQEKKILEQCELYTRYLGLLGKVRKIAEEKGEHIFAGGATGSSLIAYLLDATDINPLPRHEYCPTCHWVKFKGEGTPFDTDRMKCLCGAETISDGHNIPFESNMKSVLSDHIQLSVSHAFFKEAEKMIRDEMWDKAIVTFRNSEVSPTRFCFLDKQKNEDSNYAMAGNREMFVKFPRITLFPSRMLDKFRELEKSTGFKMKDMGKAEYSDAYFRFMEGDISGIPQLDNDCIREIWSAVKPRSYNDLLKIIGFANSTNLWRENAELLYREHRLSLGQIPAFREDIFRLISDALLKKGVYDTGLAFEVMEKVSKGYYSRAGGVDEETMVILLSLDIDQDYISLFEKINYLPPKSEVVVYLRDAIAMMVYKTKFGKEYKKIMP